MTTETCAPALCGVWEVRIKNALTGAIEHVPPAFGLTGGWSREENTWPVGRLRFDLDSNKNCCNYQPEPFCHVVEFVRDGRVFACFDYVGLTFEGNNPVWELAGRSYLLSRGAWIQDFEGEDESTTLFKKAVQQRDSYDPLGFGFQLKPTGFTSKITAQAGDSIGETLTQLSSGTLDWVEGCNENGPYLRAGELAYHTGYHLRSKDFESGGPNVVINGANLASVVVVCSDVEGVKNVSFPPKENGEIPRGSLKRWIPEKLEVSGVSSGKEMEAIAKRRWRRAQKSVVLNTATLDGFSKQFTYCLHDLWPGAVMDSTLDVRCDRVLNQVRLTGITGEFVNGQETVIAPTFVEGDA